MGEKGARLTPQAAERADQLVSDLSQLGDVTNKKMFGGYGIFESGAMFAIINSAGDVFLKADESNVKRFEDIGATKHGKMPYYQIPDVILNDPSKLVEWAKESISISRGKK
ncbi:TfoX/Sxy family protein [Fulvivirgaceae bacterium BMA10]|uniref:TfoX/Sxy family protein n=1 Tax=Splendidivirga corallicola TaxID=3051826 RepID=A0ABT8KIX4_9BACT|nr:TfoX/Sxy family protein [Fulvivirgaceae bacterium BMA10]